MRIDLPNGTIYNSDENSRAEVAALMAKLEAALNASGIHIAVCTWHLLTAYLSLWVIAGHTDISNTFSKMLDDKLVWPEDKRTNDQIVADDKKVGGIIEDLVCALNLDDPKEFYVAMNAVANLIVGAVAQFNAETAAFLKEKMVTASDWSIFKTMPPAQGGLN